jgi:hypothetical protein
MPKYRIVERLERTQEGTRVWVVDAPDEDTARDLIEDGKGTLVGDYEWPHQDPTYFDEVIGETITMIGQTPTTLASINPFSNMPDPSGMFVKVSYKGEVKEVMVSPNAPASEVLEITGLNNTRITNLRVGQVDICRDTNLRPGDFLKVE